MNIPVVVDRLTLATHPGNVGAYMNLCLGGVFVVKNVKLIEASDRSFVAMPSWVHKAKCPACRRNVGVEDLFCRTCGDPLPEAPEIERAYHDVCHPITDDFRITIEAAVFDAVRAARRVAKAG